MCRRFKFVIIFLIVQTILLYALSGFANTESISTEIDENPTVQMQEGLKKFEQGEFEYAVYYWEIAAELYRSDNKHRKAAQALVLLADAQKALGQYLRAVDTLEAARILAEKSQDQLTITTCLASLGGAYLLVEQSEAAANYLEQALMQAKKIQAPALASSINNDLGNLHIANERYKEALDAFSESVRFAAQAENKTIALNASTNAALAALLDSDMSRAEDWLGMALKELHETPDTHEKSYALINIAQTLRRISDKSPKPSKETDGIYLQMFEILNQAVQLARHLKDQRALSYAYGYLGELYTSTGQYHEALNLTARAIFGAQQIHAPELLYKWHWQEGRILKKLGQHKMAILAYRHAIETLQTIRHDVLLNDAYINVQFQESPGLVYLELADLLIQQASREDESAIANEFLVEARATIELMKATELEDYFKDECVTEARSRLKTVEEAISLHTAVVYPILLPDRLEILLTLSSGLKNITVNSPREKLIQEINSFRDKLEKRTTRQYLREAQSLYNKLIRPIHNELIAHNIDTLIFVPDKALGMIPMAALHDGRDFLIRRYAIGITPGLALTDPTPLPRTNIKVLLNGLTVPVQGFPPLYNVAAELNFIQSLYGGKTLQDEEFKVANVQDELSARRYSVVHIASHGQFENKVENSFILTFDRHLTMDDLERSVKLSQVRDQPIELLTLSACQTAAGDERAALGLAGVTVKAGARSALASLWFINDLATSILVSEFYRQLQDSSVSKAKALQLAQLKLLEDPRYQHPAYWSPFLLIGDWY
jgi:CHAT domain-containing protein